MGADELDEDELDDELVDNVLGIFRLRASASSSRSTIRRIVSASLVFNTRYMVTSSSEKKKARYLSISLDKPRDLGVRGWNPLSRLVGDAVNLVGIGVEGAEPLT
jgi:hypothetical protein